MTQSEKFLKCLKPVGIISIERKDPNVLNLGHDLLDWVFQSVVNCKF